MKIKNITLEGNGAIALLYRNKPQVLLQNIVILPGGEVMVNDTELVGDIAEIRNFEQKSVGFVKALFALAVYKRTGTLPGVKTSRNTLVESAIEVALENELRRAILDQISKNENILIDLFGQRISEDGIQNLNLLKVMGLTK